MKVGQAVKIKSKRVEAQEYFGAIGQVVELPTPGIVRVVIGRVNVAFADFELEEIGG